MTEVLQEQQASAAFSKQAPAFDEIEDRNSLLRWMRRRVHAEVMSFAHEGESMLELNCGTGIDAIYFAAQGMHVTATDNAPGMIEQLKQKISHETLHDSIIAKRCSFNNLEQLGASAQFDYIFSNFGGLNCTDRLDKVLADIDALLKPGGRFTLIIMPKICLWELAMIFRGYFKTAFRRLRKSGVQAQVEGIPFQCYYYDPQVIIRQMGQGYELRSLKGLSIAVPPPYIEHFIERHPRLFRHLENLENCLWTKAPFNRWGDHFMITMKKK